MRNAIVAVLLLVLTACSGYMVPTYEEINPRQIEPPTRWSEWYVEVANCVGEEAPPFHDIEWYQPRRIESSGIRDPSALWRYPNKVYLVEGRITREQAVKHEMLHHIMFHARGVQRGHPLRRCAKA